MGAWPFRGSKGDNYTKITSSTVETPIVPAYDEKFANITGLVIANTSASVVKVTIRDGIVGNIRTVVEVPATDTKVIGNGQDVIFEQLAKNKQWTATCGSVDSVEITAMFKE